ncbi:MULTISPECIES: hypothetical protein [unclassified Salegentibacter]|jgi:flagellar basal body-associated protein FliL|uniref:hypothetical protein n=1 Tax=unclassified Salegentibacter TaxID=2633436 RepID=UPI00094A7EF8|nr:MULTISPECIES: hypothetical protein [unclassified Salegentibacter]APS40466.1 hypothetical protein AO058_17000 [Salegentibacter sp. T436]|tara:strand:- start:76 stop:705 length:630 start_codon:yes stop_codon:yes gene_type:complete
MENEKYVQDLSDIKHMMNRSSRFISLSGLAGVFAGGYAIIGAIVGKGLLDGHNSAIDSLSPASMDAKILTQLFLLALAVLLLAIGTAVFLTTRKAKKTNEKSWDSTSKRLLINFFAPLTSGGIFCLILLQYNLIGLIAPSMLIFYGLALIHASKYTFGDLRSLGYSNLVLGLIATQFLSYGLYFWAVGFGFFHIAYGIWMYNKYDRKNA